MFKATSLFGGVQVLSILIGIARTKFAAILLGAAGVGIMGLFMAPLQLIISVTGLGLSMSAVREISEANNSGDQTRISTNIVTLKRLSRLAGMLGMIVTLVLAPSLSKWSFGNSDYTWAFIWLSLTLLLQTITNGQLAIIQGMRRLKDLAKTTVFSSLIGLVSAVPLFYYFGIKGIVPALIIAAVAGVLVSIYFSRKITIEPIKMSFRTTLFNGKRMINLGIVLTITGIVGFLNGYVLSAFISRTGGVEQVGLYNSGWSIIGQSTGLVFTAMTTDYFPRLSAHNQDNDKIRNLVKQQAEIGLIILTPILILLLGTMPIVIRILYSPEFLATVVFANWLLISILFKALLWPVGYIFPAKGDMKVYGVIEVSCLIFSIVSNITGYYLYKLEGLGISFIVNFVVSLIIYLIVAKKRYGFRYDKGTIGVFVKSLSIVVVGFLISYIIDQPVSYYYQAVILISSLVYAYFALEKRMGIREALSSFLPKIFNRRNKGDVPDGDES